MRPARQAASPMISIRENTRETGRGPNRIATVPEPLWWASRPAHIPMSALLQRNPCVPLAWLLLVGCVQRGDQPPPANFPAVDTTRMPGMPACPDLTGTFSSVVEAGSEPELVRFGALVDKESSAIQFVSQGQTVQLAMWWTSKEVESVVSTLAWRDDTEYVVWWRGARDVLSHAVMPGTPAVALASSVPGPTPVRVFKVIPECADGWLAMSDAHQLARDVGGGLLLREDHEVRRVELPLWCGDGCRGITLHVRTEARWARFPPAQLPAFRPIDFSALPIPKLLTGQEREAATAANDNPSR